MTAEVAKKYWKGDLDGAISAVSGNNIRGHVVIGIIIEQGSNMKFLFSKCVGYQNIDTNFEAKLIESGNMMVVDLK